MGSAVVRHKSGIMRVMYLPLLIAILTIRTEQGSAQIKVSDTIRCKNHPEQSYALCLPESYSPSVKWPVIFIFDPAGRGSVSIDGFKPAAGKYGYILIAPNSATLVSMDKIIAIEDHVFEDVLDRFHADSARIYTAGFSGGSRVAMAFAVLKEEISGVIGCGAGLPSVAAFQPNSTSTFSYYGLVGDKDMNYPEMFGLQDQLKHLGLKTRLEVFHEGHEWPSSNLLTGAVEWFVLQEMKNGKRAKVDSFYRNYFNRMIRTAEQLGSEKDLFEAARQYTYLLEDFPDQPEIIKFKDELSAIERSKEYKQSVKDWEKIKMKELSYRDDYLNAFNHILITKSLPDSLLFWWQDEIASLKKDTANKRKEIRLMSIRLLNMITVTAIEWGWMQLQSGNYKIASCLYRIWTVSEPLNRNSWFNLARSYAFLADTKRCLSALREAMKCGLETKQKIVQDDAFNSIKNEKAFKELLEQLH